MVATEESITTINPEYTYRRKMSIARIQHTMVKGKTLLYTLVFLALFVGIAEFISRLDFFQNPLTPPKMGSRHYQLGHKLSLLDSEIKKNGPIDCLMVGSSVVDFGFDPVAFQNGYQEASGQQMRCFNFGIDASSAASTAALVKILVEDYHPRFLIFGTDTRDYAIPADDRDPTVILETPWIKYRLGDFSLEGWLLEHSYFYRYRQHLSRLIHFIFVNTLWSETQLNNPILENGYTPLQKISTYINEPPDPQDTSFEVTYNKKLYTTYQVLDENLAALNSILEYNDQGTQVIVVEMPVSDGLYYFFGNGEADYKRFLASVSEVVGQNQVPFWQTESLDWIPNEGWSDYSHLNVIGAEIFSAWLGRQFGEMDSLGKTDVLQP